MGGNSVVWKAAFGCMVTLIAQAALAANVKVTPLGGQDGEFCPQDRALTFEDPNGTRILYDAGRTVAGPNDPRLGKIDIILVSHMHGDHVGNAHNKEPNSGSCADPDVSVSALPNFVHSLASSSRDFCSLSTQVCILSASTTWAAAAARQLGVTSNVGTPLPAAAIR